jgi:hypothetical protein
MSKEQSFRRLLAGSVMGFVVAACSQSASPSAQINSAFAPFSSTRNQAVGLVASTKRSLGAADVNALALAYTGLEEKANAYAGFMTEAVTTSSFDPARNAEYAADFEKAIATFDKSFAALEPRQLSIAGAWVPSFAQSLQARWDKYNGALAKMSQQTKAQLIADLKRETVWPNYENIATERLVGSR